MPGVLRILQWLNNFVSSVSLSLRGALHCSSTIKQFHWLPLPLSREILLLRFLDCTRIEAARNEAQVFRVYQITPLREVAFVQTLVSSPGREGRLHSLPFSLLPLRSTLSFLPTTPSFAVKNSPARSHDAFGPRLLFLLIAIASLLQ